MDKSNKFLIWLGSALMLIGATGLLLVMMGVFKSPEARFLESYKAELSKSTLVKYGSALDKEALETGYLFCELLEAQGKKVGDELAQLAIALNKAENGDKLRYGVLYDKAVEHLCEVE